MKRSRINRSYVFYCKRLPRTTAKLVLTIVAIGVLLALAHALTNYKLMITIRGTNIRYELGKIGYDTAYEKLHSTLWTSIGQLKRRFGEFKYVIEQDWLRPFADHMGIPHSLKPVNRLSIVNKDLELSVSVILYIIGTSVAVMCFPVQRKGKRVYRQKLSHAK
ncbi:hypothetical protein ACOME3_004047 [Neoechinorhynchus agilis]